MLRNKEVRQFIILFTIIAAAFAAVGFLIHPAAAMLVVASETVLGAEFFLFTRTRYKRIAETCEQIDRVLHNADVLFIGDSEEGELSILQSEITKMTLRIREQNNALKMEKEHLADSLADIAHQLRTPLTSANLILSLLEKNSDERERKALLRETEELFVQMEWLLNSLLKLSRLDADIVLFQSVPINVKSLLYTAARPLLISMELHKITLNIDVPEGMVIRGDFSWISEALQNIIKNCMQSAGENGSIDIVCQDNLLFGEITVRDSGAGFINEDLPHLFDRFYRGGNGDAAGYGIGLALCKMIITRHGGTIAAKNHPRGGALFTIRFPK